MSPRETLEIVLGKFDAQVEEESLPEPGLFAAYRVSLSAHAFRALPPAWRFFVLQHKDAADEHAVHREVNRILPTLAGIPTVFISTSPAIQLAGEFEASELPVFFLDAIDIPGRGNHAVNPRQAPFVLAVRRRMTRVSSLRLDVSPYQRGRPVYGWRFFGRARELKQLVHGNENHILIGPRRAGKTSLMLETERALKQRGEAAYYVSVQQESSDRDVLQKILRAVSPEDAANVARRAKALGERTLGNVLRRLTQRAGRTTILIDEIGTVFDYLSPSDWRNLLGELRSYTQYGNLRFIASCFQELHLRQQDEFGGPLVNLGSTLKLPLFAEAELGDLVLGPIEFWRPLEQSERRAVVDQLVRVVGGHPLLLQHYGAALFESLLDEDAGFLEKAKSLLRANLLQCFLGPVKEIFYLMKSPTQMYLFLRRCKEAVDESAELWRATLDDEWIRSALMSIGFESTFIGRRRLMDGLEIHGLTASVEGRSSVQMIASPLIYLVVKENERSIDAIMDSLQRDIGTEAETWQLRKAEAVKST